LGFVGRLNVVGILVIPAATCPILSAAAGVIDGAFVFATAPFGYLFVTMCRWCSWRVYTV